MCGILFHSSTMDRVTVCGIIEKKYSSIEKSGYGSAERFYFLTNKESIRVSADGYHRHESGDSYCRELLI